MEAEELKEKSASQYKCPSCGADMTYDPETQSLKCEHCDSIVKININKDVRERSFSELKDCAKWNPSEVSKYRCANCGATGVMTQGQISSLCPFCGSAVVIDKDELNSVKPNTLIPFEVDKDNAVRILLAWRKKKIFAPNAFRKAVDIETVRGIYYPIWTFDSIVTAVYDGELGRTKTRTVTRNGKTTTETYIDWFSVSGAMKNIFDDVFVTGSDKVNDATLNNLGSYPQNKYVVYSDEYLSGYFASNYSVDPMEAFNIAEQKMKNVFHNMIMSKYNASHVSRLDISLMHEGKAFKYLMIPMYITAMRYKTKLYNQYINGTFNDEKRNACVVGKSPVSPIKVFLTTLIVGAVVGLLVWLAYSQGLFTDVSFT
ncbi:MAG: hypothetical protein RR291_01090, partial [Clostridia bacterium]